MPERSASNWTVVITGGGSGIGAATARKVHGHGGHVAILDINEDMGRALVDELGCRALVIKADVLDEASIRAARRAIEQQLPPVEGLVNCAGRPQLPKPIEELDVADWSGIVDSHLKGTYIACREIGSAMARRGTGAVVNLASVLAFRSGPVIGYGPAKAGIVNLTESLAVQWASRGVRVNAVAPGWTDTPFLRPKERNGERDLTPILKATPLGRLMKPEEIAEVIWFLLSPAAAIVTGATIPCDGGVIAASGWTPYGGIPA